MLYKTFTISKINIQKDPKPIFEKFTFELQTGQAKMTIEAVACPDFQETIDLLQQIFAESQKVQVGFHGVKNENL